MGLDLQLYRQFYKQAYNAEVADADLVREMARRFMDSDREFQTFKTRLAAANVRKVSKINSAKDVKTRPTLNGSGAVSS